MVFKKAKKISIIFFDACIIIITDVRKVCVISQLGTIQILRKQVFGLFSNSPTLYVLIVSKNGHFLNQPTQSYVIFEWSPHTA